jgi:hypothetical protein
LTSKKEFDQSFSIIHTYLNQIPIAEQNDSNAAPTKFSITTSQYSQLLEFLLVQVMTPHAPLREQALPLLEKDPILLLDAKKVELNFSFETLPILGRTPY